MGAIAPSQPMPVPKRSGNNTDAEAIVEIVNAIASNMFKFITKKQTPEQTIAQLQQTISELTAALEVYANAENWGETAAWGNKKKNRWLGEGDGTDVAAGALSKLEDVAGG